MGAVLRRVLTVTGALLCGALALCLVLLVAGTFFDTSGAVREKRYRDWWADVQVRGRLFDQLCSDVRARQADPDDPSAIADRVRTYLEGKGLPGRPRYAVANIDGETWIAEMPSDIALRYVCAVHGDGSVSFSEDEDIVFVVWHKALLDGTVIPAAPPASAASSDRKAGGP